MLNLAAPEQIGYAEHCRANERRTVGQRGVDAELAGPAQQDGRWHVRDEGDRHAEGEDEARQVAENMERVAAEAVVDVDEAALVDSTAGPGFRAVRICQAACSLQLRSNACNLASSTTSAGGARRAATVPWMAARVRNGD